jgi:type I restriction enzyme R subunit
MRLSGVRQAHYCLSESGVHPGWTEDTGQGERGTYRDVIRHDFYERLRAYSRCLHISLSSDKLLDVFDEKEVDGLKQDWKQFSELRRAVQLRYQETVDLKEFEPKIQKLLDDHVVALPAETIIGIVNINDPDALKAIVAETGITDASKADRIASATRRVITEKMDEDPAFYRRFSELLQETIRDYREMRLSEREYLNHVIDLAGKVARKERGSDIPEPIKGNDDAQAFFGVLDGVLKGTDGINIVRDDTARVALAVIDIVKAHHIVGVWSNDVAQNNMRNAIDDYFFDVMRDQKRIEVPVEMLDELEKRLMNVARARFPD